MNKKGISLIVLIITIIIMLILTSIIVLSFSENNPIGKANEAKFKSDLSGFRDELAATHADKSISDPDYVPEDVNVNEGKYTTIKQYIPDITEEYANILLIKKGKLLYIGDDTNDNYREEEEKWAKNIGIESPYGNLGDADGDGYITEEDVIYIQNYINGSENGSETAISERQKKAMDADENGIISILDASKIQEWLIANP